MTGAPRPPTKPPSFAAPLLRIALRLGAVVAIAYGAHRLMDWASTGLASLPPGETSLMLNTVIVLVLLAYALLIAVPFVPGVEIGLSLLLMQGPPIAPLIYLASVTGLLLAYFCGRWLPAGWIRHTLLDLRLRRAADLVQRLGALPPALRVALLTERLPGRVGSAVVRWRYPLLALLINLPGTMVIGGGGGIMLIAGLSRVFLPAAVVATVFIAVLPVPLGVWFFGIGLLP